MKAAFAAALVAVYLLGRVHGRRWECRDRLAGAVEDAVEAGVVVVEGNPACWRCGRTFRTRAARLNHERLVAYGIHCEAS